MRKLIRSDGTETVLNTPQSLETIRRLIGASTLDSVLIRGKGLTMIVDDTGMIDGRPVNAKASELYHSVCRPGTVHMIHGDVVVVPSADFGD